MKTLKEYIMEAGASKSNVKKFVDLYVKFAELGLGTSAANAHDVSKEHEKALEDILSFLQKDVEKIESFAAAGEKDIVVSYCKDSDKQYLDIVHVQAGKDPMNLYSAEVTITPKGAYVEQANTTDLKDFEGAELYLLKNALTNYDKAEKFVSYLYNNYTGDLEDLL